MTNLGYGTVSVLLPLQKDALDLVGFYCCMGKSVAGKKRDQ